MSITKRVTKSGVVSYRVKVHLGYDDVSCVKRDEVVKVGLPRAEWDVVIAALGEDSELADRIRKIVENGTIERDRAQRRTHTETKSTRKAAERREAEIKLHLDQGTWQEPTKLTFGAYLDEWLEKSARPKLKQQTFELYSNIVRIYVKGALGHVPLTKLGPPAIEGLYADLARREKPLSPQTIKNVHTVIRGAMKQAVRWRYIPHNPCLNVDPPRVDGERKVRALDPEQAVTFLEAAAFDRWGVMLVFALITGARPGEYLALFWSDLNWEAGTVRIERTLFRPKGGGWILDTPKTKKSYRTVHLPAEMLDQLRAHQANQALLRAVAGEGWKGEHDFIFTNDQGGPIDEKHLQKRSFKKVLEKAGLPTDFRLYDLRHTCATLLLLADEPAKIVAERLGHSSVTTTLDVYSHVLPHMQKRSTEKLRVLLLVSPPPSEAVVT